MAKIPLVCPFQFFVSFCTPLPAHPDPPLDNTTSTYLWTAVEASVGLMCACFPIIGPMFNRLHEKLWSRSSNYLSYSSSNKNSRSRPWQRVNGASNAPEFDTLPLHNIPAHQEHFDAEPKRHGVTPGSRQIANFEPGKNDAGMTAVGPRH